MLDTGALIALERADVGARARLDEAAERGRVAVVPVLCAMEALFGARSTARVMRILGEVETELPLHPARGHQAVGLRRSAGRGSNADACVVLEALAVPGSAILTGDVEDILALLAAAGAEGSVPVLRV